MNVRISITGTQHMGEEQDTVELTTEGCMERTPKGFSLQYDETVTGMEGVSTVMRVSDAIVELERTGAMNSLLTLEKGKRHMSSYDTGYGSLMMGVYTSELHNGLSENGGELRFRYTLDINAGVASSHDVRVVVQPLH